MPPQEAEEPDAPPCSAETGEHYITRDRKEYGELLRAALPKGALLSESP